MADDHSALIDELKLGEGNSDPIKVHPELNSVSSPRPSVCALATEIFPKNSVASTRMLLPWFSYIGDVTCSPMIETPNSVFKSAVAGRCDFPVDSLWIPKGYGTDLTNQRVHHKRISGKMAYPNS